MFEEYGIKEILLTLLGAGGGSIIIVAIINGVFWKKKNKADTSKVNIEAANLNVETLLKLDRHINDKIESLDAKLYEQHQTILALQDEVLQLKNDRLIYIEIIHKLGGKEMLDELTRKASN
jgi:hypothetical protein